MSKKQPKLTPWFPGHVKPVRAGVYIASIGRNRFYRYWTGRFWTCGTYSPEPKDWPDASFSIYGEKKHQRSIKWRGLAAKP